MKGLIITIHILIILCLFSPALSQDSNLLEVYKSGKITLEADPDFADNIDIEVLFEEYSYRNIGSYLQLLNSMIISDNGDIFVSNRGEFDIRKLDNNGNYITQFGSKGKNEGSFTDRPTLLSVSADNQILINQINGKMVVFDTDGNFSRNIQLDYPVRHCAMLSENSIVVSGRVPFRNPDRTRFYVIIHDLKTGDDNFIYSYFQDNSKYRYELESDRGVVLFSSPYRFDQIHMLYSAADNIIVGREKGSEIAIYSKTGKEINRFGINGEPLKITEDIKNDYYKNIEKSYFVMGNYEITTDTLSVYYANSGDSTIVRRIQARLTDEEKTKVLETIESPAFFPDHVPYFYKLMTDSDGNILVFIYTDDKSVHKFQVYSPKGEFICETFLDLGIYDIAISIRSKNMVFYKGDLYCLVSLKETEGNPVRLIKVKLSSN
ncbi:hypothetical protein ACFL5P_03990 [candidate division KSB1 bacterium]